MVRPVTTVLRRREELAVHRGRRNRTHWRNPGERRAGRGNEWTVAGLHRVDLIVHPAVGESCDSRIVCWRRGTEVVNALAVRHRELHSGAGNPLAKTVAQYGRERLR